MFYSYYQKHGTAKSTHLRSKDDYASGGRDSLAQSEKPVLPEVAHTPPETLSETVLEDNRRSNHLTITNHGAQV